MLWHIDAKGTLRTNRIWGSEYILIGESNQAEMKGIGIVKPRRGISCNSFLYRKMKTK